MVKCLMCECEILTEESAVKVPSSHGTARYHHANQSDCQNALTERIVYPHAFASTGKIAC